MKISTYKELIVWQKSIRLVKEIFNLTEDFPSSETYGLTSQMKRAAISIPSNIAEGYGRKSHKEYLHFYAIAYGSALELETQLVITRELGLSSETNIQQAESLLTEVIKMLYVLIYKERKGELSALG